MGLKDLVTRKVLERMGRVSKFRDLLFRNKARIGSVFGGFWLWASIYGCIPDFDLEIIRQNCETIETALGLIGAFLVGAGVVDSDYRDRFTQGRISELVAKENTVLDKSKD
jgi:hypothetical protein